MAYGTKLLMQNWNLHTSDHGNGVARYPLANLLLTRYTKNGDRPLNFVKNGLLQIC